MTNTFRPWQLLSVIIAGMLSEQQQHIIEYLKEENRILRAQIGNRRLRLSDDDRRRLPAKGKALSPDGYLARSAVLSHQKRFSVGTGGSSRSSTTAAPIAIRAARA